MAVTSMHVRVGKRALLFALLVSACGGGTVVGGGGGGDVSVSVSATTTILHAGQPTNITATVLNAGGNTAVMWTLTGPDCPNSCGTLTNFGADSVTFIAPQFISADTVATVTATSVADPTKSGSVVLSLQRSISVNCPTGNESLLNGQYAFLLRGEGPGGAVVVAGSLTADGLGGITAGSIDSNRASSVPVLSRTITNASIYSVGPDRRGCIGLVDSAGSTLVLRIALSSVNSGTATRGRIIEFDDAFGTGTRGEGFLALQDPSSFSTNQVAGNYVFGFVGADSNTDRFEEVCVINAASGVLTNGNLDLNDNGVVTANVTGVTGTCSVAATGRGTLTLSSGVNNGFVIYMITTAEFLAMSSDQLDPTHPIQSGEAFLQTLASFDATSLNAAVVVSTTGLDTNLGGPMASVGLLTPDGAGSCQLVIDINDAGLYLPTQTTSGTYTPATNGRTPTAALNPPPPVLYLIGTNRGLWFGTDPAVTFGQLEQQIGAPFNNTSVTGTYDYGTEGAAPGSRVTATGADAFDGVMNNQAIEDESSPSGLFQNLLLPNQTYSFLPSSVPAGRGFLDGIHNRIAYIVTTSKLIAIDANTTTPRLILYQQ
jgi:hypothetical protein